MTTVIQRDLFGGRKGEYELPEGASLDTCRSCGAAIVWKKTTNEKWIPLSVATTEERGGVKYALTHFSDCPESREWSQRR